MLIKKLLVVFIFEIIVLQTLWAHDQNEPTAQWNWDPLILSSLFILGLGYFRGYQNLIQKPSRLQVYSFIISILTLIIALISPLNQWSNELQTWHMLQHMLIMVVAAPFFVMAAPMDVLIWWLPLKLRRKLSPLLKWLYGYKSGWYFFGQPLILWSVFAMTLWIWHLPRFYEAALQNAWLHDFQHISFFISASLFWRLLLDPVHRFKLNRILGIFYLFATTLHATLLGVYMTLSPNVWYKFYLGKTTSWNLSGLEDQQLAGLIMWMPACAVYVLATAFIFIQWSKESNGNL